MRRSVLTSLASMSFTVLIGALAACATSPSEPISGAGSDTNPSTPSGDQGVKLPPPSNPSGGSSGKDATDAGETKDSGSSEQDSGTPPPPPPPPDAGSTTPTACDMSDPVMAFKAAAELESATPRVCDMSGNGCQTATECCFTIYMVCVDK